MNEYKNHPYYDDYSVISEAFDLLLKEIKGNFHILRGYKGALSQSVIDQLDFEEERVKKVKNKVLDSYYKKLV